METDSNCLLDEGGVLLYRRPDFDPVIVDLEAVDGDRRYRHHLIGDEERGIIGLAHECESRMHARFVSVEFGARSGGAEFAVMIRLDDDRLNLFCGVADWPFRYRGIADIRRAR